MQQRPIKDRGVGSSVLGAGCAQNSAQYVDDEALVCTRCCWLRKPPPFWKAALKPIVEIANNAVAEDRPVGIPAFTDCKSA
jgi:hypothetical protein